MCRERRRRRRTASRGSSSVGHAPTRCRIRVTCPDASSGDGGRPTARTCHGTGRGLRRDAVRPTANRSVPMTDTPDARTFGDILPLRCLDPSRAVRRRASWEVLPRNIRRMPGLAPLLPYGFRFTVSFCRQRNPRRHSGQSTRQPSKAVRYSDRSSVVARTASRRCTKTH